MLSDWQQRKRFNKSSLLDSGPMLTPLIDIIFLVLIFFMINNSPTQRSFGIETPSMPSAEIANMQTAMVINVSSQGQIFLKLEGSELDSSWQDWQVGSNSHELEASLRSNQEALSLASSFRLRADQSLPYKEIIDICNVLSNWELPIDLDVSGLPAQAPVP